MPFAKPQCERITLEFEPPILIPPHGTADISGGLEFCTVTVKDGNGSVLAFGRYQRQKESSNKFTLISGTVYKAPKPKESLQPEK